MSDDTAQMVADEAADFLQAFFEYLAEEEVPSEHFDPIASALVSAVLLKHIHNGTQEKNTALIGGKMWRRYFRENFDG